eukprot:gene11976-12119_t
MDTISGSIPSAAMSVADDSSNTLTVIPVTPGMNLLKQLPADCTEDHIRAVFGQYGVVEQVQMYSDASSTPNTGCGYVTMASQEQAASALAALQQNHSLPAPLSCLAVSWALAVEQQQQPQAWGSPQSSLVANAGRTVFFAKVPPSAVSSEVEQLFAAFGKLSEVNLFRAWAGAKHSKRYLAFTYSQPACLPACLPGLVGSDCPMVVEWMDLKKQRPIAPPPAMEKPPLGCSCDAYKLLLANVPVSMSEEELAALLGQFGRVVQISLAAEATGVTSSGHVWYATKMGADALSSRAKTEPIWLRMAAGVAGLPAAGGAALVGLPTAVLRTSDNTGGYMAVDMCEAMLDLYDTSGMGLPMPVHLQPAMAAQEIGALACSEFGGRLRK